MTLNKNALKNIGGEITDGILLNGDAQKIEGNYWWRDYLSPYELLYSALP
jgi:hypothetical protein